MTNKGNDNNDEVFNRLMGKKIARQSVPPRDTSVIKNKNEELINDEKTEISHSSNSKQAETTTDNSSVNEQTNAEAEILPKLPETVRRTIRLETEIDSQLDMFCNKHKITRDNFIEAAFAICINNEAMQKKILKEAQKRYQERKRAGEQRKYQTLAKKINSLSSE